MHNDDFAELVRKARKGDPHAAEELVRQYEPAIRRELRFRLPRSQRYLIDSLDLCQSVFGSFFIRMAAGQYEVADPGQLLGLLTGMARNKILEKLRKRREVPDDHQEPPSTDDDPTWQVMLADLMENIAKRLAPHERVLWVRRREDRTWEEIAAEVGGTPNALKKQYSRAMLRVGEELDL